MCATRSRDALVKWRREHQSCVRRNKGLLFPACPPFAKAVEVEVNHRRGVECERLTKDEAADDCYAEWPAQLGADAGRKNEGNAPKSAATVVIRIGRKRRRHA